MRPMVSSSEMRCSAMAIEIRCSIMRARLPTQSSSPVDATAVTPSPGCDVGLRTPSGRIWRARAARRIAMAIGCPSARSAPAARARTSLGSSLLAAPPQPASTSASSGSPSRSVPRAQNIATATRPARSHASELL